MYDLRFKLRTTTKRSREKEETDKVGNVSQARIRLSTSLLGGSGGGKENVTYSTQIARILKVDIEHRECLNMFEINY